MSASDIFLYLYNNCLLPGELNIERVVVGNLGNTLIILISCLVMSNLVQPIWEHGFHFITNSKYKFFKTV